MAALPRHHTAQHLERLEKVLNARDLAEASPVIRPGRIFRAGSPAQASVHDVLLLRRELRLRQLVDLRSAEERKEDSSWGLVLCHNGRVVLTVEEQRLRDLIEGEDGDDVALTGDSKRVPIDAAHEVQLLAAGLEDIELHRVSLLEKGRFIRGLLRKLPFTKIAYSAFYKLIGNEDAMRGTLMPEINRGGLPLVYQILLDSSQAEILRVMEAIVAAAQAQRPQLFFCKLGKDRTGLVAALVLACCGVPENDIVADYARSDGVDAMALGGIEKMKDIQGMDSAIFSKAPPEAMRAALQYTREAYGGLRRYLSFIGFTAEKQEALRRAMTEGDWPLDGYGS
jgi:protein tyrosine/serine phosphatase